MNNTLHSFVLSVLSYSVVIPGAAMCIVPVAKYLKRFLCLCWQDCWFYCL